MEKEMKHNEQVGSDVSTAVTSSGQKAQSGTVSESSTDDAASRPSLKVLQPVCLLVAARLKHFDHRSVCVVHAENVSMF